MMATCIIQPIDMVKIRIQAESQRVGKGHHVSPFKIIREMMGNGRGFG